MTGRSRRLVFALAAAFLAIAGTLSLYMWLAAKFAAAEVQRRAVAAIEAAGGEVVYEHQYHYARGELPEVESRMFFGRDMTSNVIVLHGQRLRDADLSEVAKLSSLQRIELDGAPVTDAGVVRLAALRSAKEFDLRNTPVTDTAMEALCRAPSVISLNLGGTAITDRALVYAAQAPTLRELELNGTAITDAGLFNLREKVPQLTWLGLRNTRITDEGLRVLMDASAICKLSLTELSQIFRWILVMKRGWGSL